MNYDKAKICATCGIATSNLPKHIRRQRCAEQHIRKMVMQK